MINLGLVGAAGCGKDTVADILVKRYGFVKYSFSDALYREVAEAFGLEDASVLYNRETKEEPTTSLALDNCKDELFHMVYIKERVTGQARSVRYGKDPNSPREILQLWGTEYRRAQDPDYWIKKADEWIYDVLANAGYPEQRPQYFVNTAVRFANEQDWIHKFTCGNVWHIRRGNILPVNAHVSESGLPVREVERELWNNDTIDRLAYGIDLLLRTSAQFVKVLPMEETSL